MWGAILRLATFCTTLAVIASMATQPWVQPVVERSLDEVAARLDAATAAVVDRAWLAPRLEAALADRDRDQIALLTAMAGRHGVALTDEEARAVEMAAHPDVAERAFACVACAYDPANCLSLTDVVACALPVELTPVGDVNALRRGAADWLADDPVDRVDVALATVGLAATGVAVASGGSSLTMKAGASLLRVGRRVGVVSAQLSRSVVRLAGDAGGLRILRTMTGDIASVRRQTSTVDALALIRHVDGPADAGRLARVAEAAGPATRGHFEALGKARVFRTLVRLSRPAVAFLGLLATLMAQVMLMGLRLLLSLLLARARLRGVR